MFAFATISAVLPASSVASAAATLLLKHAKDTPNILLHLLLEPYDILLNLLLNRCEILHDLLLDRHNILLNLLLDRHYVFLDLLYDRIRRDGAGDARLHEDGVLDGFLELALTLLARVVCGYR